ncbi:MAG: tryptophan--tRNA ligase [Gammaproteobacteria bacterium]|nr:tryptophan--tRNA ligase [Gammaproteobacteria bacterium]
MSKEIYLTGITTTGTPHLGNYVGAIKPAIEASQNKNNQCFYFLADYHALIKCQDPTLVRQSRMEIAATWLALGLDVDTSVFYRQSDIPEIQELNWILSCVAAKGLLNRAHAYKALVAENETSGTKDPDKGITMGLFCYPVLMAADILMFNANKVPVGKDQIQHIEMTRDIAARFNYIYGEFFTLPEAQVEESAAVLSGLDGRKMSKSYNNTIPLFTPEKKLRKLVMKIKTNSLEPGEPKDHKTCTLFQIYSAFSSSTEVERMRQQYADGIAWGEMKQTLFEKLNNELAAPRERYESLMEQPTRIEEILLAGRDQARARAKPLLEQLREAVGIT